jgi:hypothetical protein
MSEADAMVANAYDDSLEVDEKAALFNKQK